MLYHTTSVLEGAGIMGLLTSTDWRAAKAIAGIFHANPFLPERVELERQALGTRYKEEGPLIWARPGEGREEYLGNIPAMRERAEAIVSEMRRRIEGGRTATRDELLVYEDLALFLLYARHMDALEGIVTKALQRTGWDGRALFWPDFQADFQRYFHLPGQELPSRHDSRVIFAWLFQIERAFTHIYSRIIGGSMPVAQLRAAAWESIFTHDMRRYTQVLHKSMAHVTTLITGPSGTGKELVAQAIGRSRYLAFDVVEKRFAESCYTALNLSAFVPTLLESELFGHIKASFVGALDRKGWLEQCSGPDDTVLLDEIGELDEAIQVKLLRVLQERCFVRVGETTDRPREFHGKIIAATNRDLAAAMRAGKFREDFYHRLCDDHIVTPSLAEQLADRPQDLTEMVRFLVSQILGELTRGPDGPTDAEMCTREADGLTGEAVDWIEGNLKDYPWPGNFRELSRCVRNVMIHGSYRPPMSPRDGVGGLGPIEEFLRNVRRVELTRVKLLGCYYALAYFRSDENWTAAGERLDVDWRTVRDGHDPAFLEKLRRARAVEER
jgi:sigma-54 specific flagellar transcriptional regulator A